jgi:hypothetical protein
MPERADTLEAVGLIMFAPLLYSTGHFIGHFVGHFIGHFIPHFIAHFAPYSSLAFTSQYSLFTIQPPAICDPEPKTQNLKPETRNSKPKFNP